MNWDALGAIGELIGAGAVVLTLIYLSLQMKLSTKQQKIESQRAISEEFNRIMTIYYDIEKAGMIIRAQNEWTDATAQEQLVFVIWMIQYSNHMQTLYSFWQNDGMDEASYLIQENIFLAFVCTEGGKSWWSEFTNMSNPEYSQRLNERIASENISPAEMPWAETKLWPRSDQSGT